MGLRLFSAICILIWEFKPLNSSGVGGIIAAQLAKAEGKPHAIDHQNLQDNLSIVEGLTTHGELLLRFGETDPQQ